MADVAVLGGGNGGQALAGSLASRGHSVRLYCRQPERLGRVVVDRTIEGVGVENWRARLAGVTDDLEVALATAEIVFLATTADAHGTLARQLAPLLRDGQILVLNPGRTGGALEVVHVLGKYGSARVLVAEAQSLLYACRAELPGRVRLIGRKARVPLATLPAADLDGVMARLRPLFDCFVPASSVLETSFANMGAVLHPVVAILNTGTIERGEKVHFYRDVSDRVAEMVMRVDAERLAVAQAYGLGLDTVQAWMLKAYPQTRAHSLAEQMRTSPAYAEILAPGRIESRLLTEDVPTGLVPFESFGRVAGVPVPIMSSLIELASGLLGRDLRAQGRTLEQMGLRDMSVRDIVDMVRR